MALRFFRDGFYRDFCVLILVSVVVGALFSSGLAWAIDSHFGETINEMIGEHGQYDLILHIREESKDAALRELDRLANQQFPGANVNESITIAGQSNVFFGFPTEFRTQEVLEGLPGLFSGIPGLNGYTVVIDPSILIRGVHPSVREKLQRRFSDVGGVQFAFRDGANMLVLLDSEEVSQEVAEAIEGILAEYEILEVRFPMGFEVDTQQAADAVLQLMRERGVGGQIEDVTLAEHGEDLDAFLKTLVEMRDFLRSYASKVRIEVDSEQRMVVGERLVVQGAAATAPVPGQVVNDEQVIVEVIQTLGDRAEGMIIQGSILEAAGVLEQPGYRLLSENRVGEKAAKIQLENERYRLNYAINESLRLLRELEDLAVEASLAVDHADAVLHTFQEALMQLEVLQIQMRQLNEGIASEGSQSASEQLLISLLLNGLLKNLAQGGASLPQQEAHTPADSLENLDVEEMRSSLDSMAQQIGNVQDIDVMAIIDQIEMVRDTLPELNDEEIGRSIRLIDAYLGGQVIPGERVQLLVHNGLIDAEELEPAVRETVAHAYANIYVSSVGMINPDVRSELFRVLKEIRATIAGMLAIISVMVMLVLDHATLFTAMKWVRKNQVGSRRRMVWLVDGVIGFGGGVGALTLLGVYTLSGAEIPFANLGTIAVVGLALGSIVAVLAERFSPVNTNEMMAGQALGLSNVQIMREIVIPASRPGLMNLLNRWKQHF